MLVGATSSPFSWRVPSHTIPTPDKTTQGPCAFQNGQSPICSPARARARVWVEKKKAAHGGFGGFKKPCIYFLFSQERRPGPTADL